MTNDSAEVKFVGESDRDEAGIGHVPNVAALYAGALAEKLTIGFTWSCSQSAKTSALHIARRRA